MNAKLILENGIILEGIAHGATVASVAELVFNTGVTGYQEVLSDNSYTHQMVVMNFVEIGNYGINENDFESVVPTVSGLIVNELSAVYSHYEASESVSEYLKKHNIPAISGIDTRYLTSLIKKHGTLKAMITTDMITSNEDLVSYVKDYIIEKNHVKLCSTTKPYRLENSGYRVAVIDCGVKLNILRSMHNLGFDLNVLPYDTSYETLLKFNPDALFVSNGPGDPIDVPEVIELIKNAQGHLPIFGICLGHQIIALANNAQTYKMKFGHRGCNHPVKNLLNNKIEFTSQNHSYAVVDESIAKTKFTLTHVNVLDKTCEGIAIADEYIFSVQYHPEAAPGPMDSHYLFDEFKVMIDTFKKEQNLCLKD